MWRNRRFDNGLRTEFRIPIFPPCFLCTIRETPLKPAEHQAVRFFVSRSRQTFVASILHKLKALPILTLGDIEDFTERIGMLELTPGKRRIGFNIDLGSARQPDLKMAAPRMELVVYILD